MSTSSQTEAEVLRAKKRPWLRRLWVRISLVLLLIFTISVVTWWWPRRTMVAVWWVNGTVYCDSDRQRTIQWLTWWDPAGTGWGSQHFSSVYRVLSWTSFDGEITGTQLKDAEVNDEWLIRLRRFPKLRWLGLHDRQLGQSLGHLRESEQLTAIHVTSASDRRLVELQRVPHLEDVFLWNTQADDIGLDALTSLPKLKSLFFGDCQHADELLQRLPELPHLETLVIQDCHGFSDEDLACLQRLPNLKYLDIVKSAPVSDAGLLHLSKLANVETLCVRKSSGQITDVGLQALQRLQRLKELIVIRGDLTPEQLKTLDRLLPNTTIRMN
jgi:hypothetical protein